MITVRFALRDFMDEDPVGGATVTITLEIVPRWSKTLRPPEDPNPGFEGLDPRLARRDPVIAGQRLDADMRRLRARPTGPGGGPGGGPTTPPITILQPEWSLARRHEATVTSDANGIAATSFDAAADFGALASAQSPTAPGPPTDVVGAIRVRVVAAPFDREFRFHRGVVGVEGAAIGVTDVVGPDSQFERTLALDFAKAIVGATTPTSTMLWFQLHADLITGYRYACEVAEDAAGAAVRELTATFLASRAKTSVVRVTGLTEGRRYRYRLVAVGSDGSRRGLAKGTFATPVAGDRNLRFVFASCHLPTNSASMERWRHLAKRTDYDFLLLTGDQVYGDGLDRYAGSDWLEKYVDLYDRFWAEWPMREVLRRTPTFMILDDHEIDDDWGVVPVETEAQRQRNRAGVTAYRIYQQAHNPGGYSGTFHYSFRWGPASFFMLDNRTRRTLPDQSAGVAHPVLGDAQYAALVRWAQAPETRAADLVFVVAPVPIAFLPVQEVLRLIEEIREAAEEAGAAGGGILGGIVGGIVGGLVAGPPGILFGAALGGTLGAEGGGYIGQELADDKIAAAGLADMTTRDLADMWSAGHSQRDLLAVLDTLFDLGNDADAGAARPRAMFLIGGDVHSGSMHLVRSRRHGRNPVAFQAISSAISQVPATDKIYEKVVRHITNDVSISTLDLVGSGFDFETLAENEFGDANANFALDDLHDRNYAAQIVDFVAERNFGKFLIEPAPGPGRSYDVYAWVEGTSRALRRGFRIELDAQPAVRVSDLYGGLAAIEGRITMLRAHRRGSGYGPRTDPLDADAVVSLDTKPEAAFGLQLRGRPDATAEFDALRSAFRRGTRVRIEYIRTGYDNGMIHRVIQLA